MIANAVAIQPLGQASCRLFIEMSTRRVRNATIANSRSTPPQPLKAVVPDGVANEPEGGFPAVRMKFLVPLK
jgi:hypothetical protein